MNGFLWGLAIVGTVVGAVAALVFGVRAFFRAWDAVQARRRKTRARRTAPADIAGRVHLGPGEARVWQETCKREKALSEMGRQR